MPYKPQPFDYEPVTRRGAGPNEVPQEDDERFTVARQPVSSAQAAASADDWLRPESKLHQTASEEAATLPDAAESNLAPSRTRTAKRQSWVLRRGHTLSFIGLFLFTLVLYFRPYEMFPALAGYRSIAYWIAVLTLLVFIPTQLGLEGTLTARPREVNLLLLLTLAAFLSVPLAIDRAEAWYNFTEFGKVVVMFIVMVNVMRTERRLKILLFLALAVGCVVSISAINDYRLGRFVDAGQRIKGIIGGMFENSNDLAMHLVMMTPIAIALFFSVRSIIKKAFFGACAALMIAGNLVTFSRGGLLGLVAALCVLLWKLGRRHRLLVFVVALSLAFSLIVFMPGVMVERLASIFDPSAEESAGASAISRRALLFRSLLVMARHPLFGIGIGNFHAVSIREQVSHNSYTQVGAEVGVAAMLLYIMLILTAFKRARGVEKETLAAEHHSRFYYLAAGLQASLIGYMICSFFSSVAFHYSIYYLVGYVICLHRVHETSQQQHSNANRPIEAEKRTKQDSGSARNWRMPVGEAS
ncbi:MAG TPA: O-antigen ligase family protein [Pyrinomonadaceae bacterium]